MQIDHTFGSCFVDHASECVVLNWHRSFHPNNLESTFGFHTRTTCPERNRICRSKIHPNDPPSSDGEKITTFKARKLAFQVKNWKEGAVALNILNILGYVPVLGLIPCAVRLIFPLLDKKLNPMWDEPRKIRIMHFTRGAIEGVGAGILFLLPDIIFTIKRFAG